MVVCDRQAGDAGVDGCGALMGAPGWGGIEWKGLVWRGTVLMTKGGTPKSHVRDSSHASCRTGSEGIDPLTDHNLACLPIDKKHLRGIPSENTCSKVVAATSRFRTS